MTDTVHLITPEYAPARGGVASHTRQLAAGLAASGASVHVWAPAGAEPGGAEGVHVHAELGRFSSRDLARVAVLLADFEPPRRLIVQWVPQGFGYRAMNVGFCAWVWKMARRGELVEIFVHEPHLALEGGSWRQTAAALVQRVMSIMLLRAARRVWIAIPAWERRWRPYALGRSVPFVWLPIPSALPPPDAEDVAVVRRRMNASRVLGHLGTYGRPIAPLLCQALAETLARVRDARVLLIGEGSDRFRQEFAAACPAHAPRVSATGVLSDAAVAAHVAACDVLVQPYPDGISSRRTTAMAGLYLGVPVVTTVGALSEPFWPSSGAVRVARVGDAVGLARHVQELLGDPRERRLLSQRGQELYQRMFGLDHIVSALRAA